MCQTAFLNGSDLAEYTRKGRLIEDESKHHKNNGWIEINFVLGKNGGHMPGSLGGRSIVVVRQAGRQAEKCLTLYVLGSLLHVRLYTKHS